MADEPVAFFNLTRRECHLKDGRILPITKLFDRFDCEIDGEYEIEDLRSFVAGEGDYWVAVYVDSFEPVTLN